QHDINTSGTGRSCGSGQYQSGEIVRCYAMSAMETQFAGWYENNKLIFGNAEFSYMARGTREISLKFIPLDRTYDALIMRVCDEQGSEIDAAEIPNLTVLNIDIRKWKILNLSARVYVAAYNTQGEMCAVFAQDILLESDASCVQLPVSFSDECETIRVFLLHNAVAPGALAYSVAS
ncbi:MAG: hypothetical protein Q4C12_07985, partial [Clostridia bacterium]|nr:hypothetical protein [Clostridia bacterium]